MSNIFEALKKAQGEQLERLFATNSNKKAEPGNDKDFRRPQIDDKQKACPAAEAPAVAGEQTLKPQTEAFATCAAPARVKHPQITVNDRRGALPALNNSSPVSAQFSLLKAKILVAARKQQTHVICVTSAVAQEGKTFVATNLALTLAAECERGVVIIDCDLHHPTVHNSFGIKDATGLADYLQSERGNIDALIIDTDRKLAIIPAGRMPKNPLPLFKSEKFQNLIKELRTRYDFVIIDSPPAGPLADAEILASLSDGLVFVIRSGVTPITIAQRSLKMLGKHKILGAVLNATSHAPSYSYYNYSYGGPS